MSEPSDSNLYAALALNYGEQVAADHAKFKLDQEARDHAATAIRHVLEFFPSVAGACMIMSAALASRIEIITSCPAYVVAGSLFIGDSRIFGADSQVDFDILFGRENLSWDGHAWVVFGDLLIDVSLFRTARARFCHPLLKQHVRSKFSRVVDALATPLSKIAETGFMYHPHYVLLHRQRAALVGGARAFCIDQLK